MTYIRDPVLCFVAGATEAEMQLIFPRRFRVAGQGAAPAMTSGQDKRTVTSSLDALTLRDVERIDFDAFSRHFALELRRDVTFLAPTVVVDYVSDNDTRRVLRNSRSSERCVYTGSVMADADSRVTVTFCPHLVRPRDNQTRDLQNKQIGDCVFLFSLLAVWSYCSVQPSLHDTPSQQRILLTNTQHVTATSSLHALQHAR